MSCSETLHKVWVRQGVLDLRMESHSNWTTQRRKTRRLAGGSSIPVGSHQQQRAGARWPSSRAAGRYPAGLRWPVRTACLPLLRCQETVDCQHEMSLRENGTVNCLLGNNLSKPPKRKESYYVSWIGQLVISKSNVFSCVPFFGKYTFSSLQMLWRKDLNQSRDDVFCWVFFGLHHIDWVTTQTKNKNQ